MKSKTGWIFAIVLGLIILFFIPVLLMGGYGGMMGPGMMGRYGYISPLAYFGMAFMWLIPLGIVVLVVLGVVSLFNNWNNANKPSIGANLPARTCPNCGKPSQVDWITCPYCGKSLS